VSTQKRVPVGTVVEWEPTHEWAHHTLRRGVVVAFVPAGEEARRHLPALRAGHADFNGVTRSDRYVMTVTRRSGVLDYYAPYAAIIERAVGLR